MKHFNNIVNRLHDESLLNYADIEKIYKKINGNIFGDKCIIYNTRYKKNLLYYCIRTKRVSLIHYLMQSINEDIPKINNYSYKRICKTHHCICLNHYKRYICKYREKKNNPIAINYKDDLTPKGCLKINFDT